MTEFKTIRLSSIDHGGVNYDITGTYHGKRYSIEISCEYDGRDVDSNPTVPGEYDPMHDWDQGDSFFDKLCEEDRFMNLYNKGYKAWELLPENPE
jgi:hypothetical protein